jgi:hypothetical protein
MNSITNPLRSTWYAVAGGMEAYRRLDKEARAKCRDAAVHLLEMGADYATAKSAESTDRRGFVYIIGNPAWPDFVKVGRAFDPESRLLSLQTGDPNRGYRLYRAVYFHDCYAAEREMHLRLEYYRAGGEWFALSHQYAEFALNYLRETL